MSIRFDSQRNALTLETCNTTYQMQIDGLGHLLHLYYGRRLEGSMEHLYAPQDCGFSPNPYLLRLERTWSMDLLPQEYSGGQHGRFPAQRPESHHRGRHLRRRPRLCPA